MGSIMSEAKYLQQQSKRAKADMGKAIHGLKKDALDLAAPRRLIGKHPWMSLIAALVLGYMASGLFAKSKKSHSEAHESKRTAAPPPPQRDRMRIIKKWIARGKLVVGLIKPLIEGFLAVQAARETSDEPHETAETETSRTD
jgi:hypothetical protein